MGEYTEGTDVTALPPSMRALAFTVQPSHGRLSVTVGRQHQTEFFERVVQNKERLACISRSHFELTWEPPARTPMLRKLSQNPLMVDNRPIGPAEAIPIPDGTRLSLGAAADAQQAKFLILRVTIRSQGAVKAEGAHPAAKTARRNSAPSFHMQAVVEHSNVPAPPGLVAVLECTFARGVDVTRLGQELRAIHLTKDIIDIGRHPKSTNSKSCSLTSRSGLVSYPGRTFEPS